MMTLPARVSIFQSKGPSGSFFVSEVFIVHAAAYPSPSNPTVSLPRLSILGHPPMSRPASKPRAEKPKETRAAALVLFGLDERGKAHAAWFANDHAEAGTAAAEAMCMFALPVEDDAVRALAGQVPQGKIFASGKAFVPFVKASLFDALVMHLPEDQREQARQPVSASGGKASSNGYAVASGAADGRGAGAATVQHDFPADWSKIKVGSVVLASEGRDDGWYEADVLEVLPGNRFKLRWHDWPDLPKFERTVTEIALLHPQYKLD